MTPAAPRLAVRRAAWALLALAAVDRGAAAQPAAVAVTLTPARPTLLLGADNELDIAIDVAGPAAASFVPVRVLANVGTLETPRAVGPPGHFITRYLPPADRFPEVALLVVEVAGDGRHAHAAVSVPLEGSTAVPFHTSPGAAVTMRVADRMFGPQIADKLGHVDIAIQVPPGARTGVARAVDRAGVARETEVDLQLPAFPRCLILAPPEIGIGSFAEVLVIGVSGDGRPTDASRITLSSSAGLVHPVGHDGPGEALFLVEAPRKVGSGALALTATAAGAPPARVNLTLPLRPGPTATLIVSSDVKRLIVGSREIAHVAIAARDQFGNATPLTGLQARVDGQPCPVVIASGGVAILSVDAPEAYAGRDRLAVDVSLGDIRQTLPLHVTGGPPVRLTLDIDRPRVVADGRRSSQLRVQAVDVNGTPTEVPGLSWSTPEGRVRDVRVPRDGEYVADYVPKRAREPHRELVAVMASDSLRAEQTLDVIPPPVRLVAALRAGFYSNLGHMSGPIVLAEGLRPVHLRDAQFMAGLTAGYLHSDLTTPGLVGAGSGRLEITQFPVLALARLQANLPRSFQIAASAGAGYSLATTRITVVPQAEMPPLTVNGTASGVALAGGLEITYPLSPGWLLIGARYLWIDLGRTSQGDDVNGNSAGLVADIGYRMEL